MRLPSFNVADQRNVKNAACDAVPPLMIIAGPNGAGKSTILNHLRSSGGQQNILYIGPNRASRRSNVTGRQLLQFSLRIDELMSQMGGLPGLEGLNIGNTTRDAWDYDPAATYVKHAICQVAIDRQAAITELYDRQGELPKGTVPNVWAPLAELTTHLLPHLEFEKVDNAQPSNIRCLWRTHWNASVDLDELSSGEKAVIQLFYPLVEHRIREIMATLRGEAPVGQRPEVAILVDEPELHLHPSLQARVMDYFRELSAEGRTQFIVATQSPTMVDNATASELFVLRPRELVDEGENQLRRVAESDSDLLYIREVFGGTSNLTALQPIVVVEGSTEESKRGRYVDRKVFRRLSSRFDRTVVIPAGGKGEVLKLSRALSKAVEPFGKALRVVGLVDYDLRGAADESSVALPVSMIENFLLDPECIFGALQSVAEKLAFKNVTDVEIALDEILNERLEAEIERRALSLLGISVFRPKNPVKAADTQASAAARAIESQYSAEAVESALGKATKEVEAIVINARRREEFHGKAVLDSFYAKYVHSTGMSREIFVHELARLASFRKSVNAFFDGFFENILGAAAKQIVSDQVSA